jgi:DNA-binding SARP family transcriptional activator
MDDELDELEAAFVERDDIDAQAVVLGLGAVSAHARSDTARLLTLTERIRVLPRIDQQPELQFFVDAVDAAEASLAGDVERCLQTIEAMSFDQVPLLVIELITRLHSTMLVLAGRAEEAVAIARPLVDSPHAYVRSVPSMVRWLAGDPADYLATPLSMEPLLVDNNLYRFVSAGHGAGVAASLGDHALAEVVRREFEPGRGRELDARDSAIAAGAIACCKILDHDEAGAVAAIDDHLARHGLEDAPSEIRLRRNLAIPYVTNETARQHWDAMDLGPMHLRARALARQLLDARDGRLGPQTELGPPATALTSLPLAWSVELAVRARAVGCSDGEQLIRTLAAWLPAATGREVEWLADHGDDTCRAEAAQLLDELRALTAEPLRIDVLGPLRVRTGEVEASSPELRRSRVRALLELLVLRGSLRRERISDLLWPDLEPETAAQNLRVTLSRLRRLLEPDRPAGQSSMVRSHADSVELIGPPLVETDLGLFRSHVVDADHAKQSGDSAEEIASLTRAVDLWRGDPLVDLASVGELEGEVEYLRGSLLGACLRLGELLLVAGRFDEALHRAERGRLASPYSERPHRLAIACHLQRQDHEGLAAAVRAAHTMLAELGVQPEEATQMLLRRADSRLGRSVAT